MIGRNHPCHCGSGKKYKKCCIEKKKDNRIASITMDMGEPIAINGLEIDSNGNFLLKKDNETITPKIANLTQQISREDKKDKVTSNVPLLKLENLTFDLFNVISNLDNLFVIDTNTVKKAVNNTEVRESACAVQYFQKIEDELVFVNGFGKVLNDNPDIHGEKIALCELISYILFELKIGKDKRVGIVTDHDLGNHGKYNTREIPLIEGTKLYLPENFVLIYASADKKNENFLNQLIYECDKKATELLKNRK